MSEIENKDVNVPAVAAKKKPALKKQKGKKKNNKKKNNKKNNKKNAKKVTEVVDEKEADKKNYRKFDARVPIRVIRLPLICLLSIYTCACIDLCDDVSLGLVYALVALGTRTTFTHYSADKKQKTRATYLRTLMHLLSLSLSLVYFLSHVMCIYFFSLLFPLFPLGFCTGNLESRPRALDVIIGGFSMTAHGQELVKDTSIEMTIGRRYGLIGRNGSGKTTFLRCLADRDVPIPDHIDIFMLEEEAPKTDMTPLEYVLAQMKTQVARLEKEAEELTEELGPEHDLVTDIYERLDEMEPSQAEPRASYLLNGLGFGKEMGAKATKDMSGGWRMRVALAHALFVRPSLLLLDEPTNHLDLETCVWLENYLATYDRCLIVVSHSQDFLNEVCTHIIHITPKGTLKNYSGNYDQFIKTKKENETQQMRVYRKEQDDIKHLKNFIATCGTYSNLVKQAKSKQKILDKMEEAGLTEKVEEEIMYNFKFAKTDLLAPPLIAFNNVSFAYSGDMKDALYKNVNIGVDQDSRVALVGPNGTGKSTLLKLMTGDLDPTEGEVRRHLHLQIGRYFQHSVEQLDEKMTTLEFMQSSFPEKKMGVNEWRQHMGKYGISGPIQAAKISTLSDGLKSRIVFGMIAAKHPHLLLLDEPTNHLDMECIDSLADAINSYSGGLVLVSHDFRLVEQVAKTLWICDNKSISIYNGDIRKYKTELIKEMVRSNRLQKR